jgi:protoporphyrin/coproporphyrin ferrochelatase
MNSELKNIAVVLFNLGGPDSRAAIRPFLLNFFNDPNIIGAPKLIRMLIAQLIAWRRSRREAGDSYAKLGDKSPLLENTQQQASALEQALNSNADNIRYQVHVCMRYWHPMADAVVRDVQTSKPDQIILLPLYPQFSTTTTWSSLQEWRKQSLAQGLNVPTSLVCCYPEEQGFITASARRVREVYDHVRASHANLKGPRVLFSAHGLPEKIIKSGDPYQAQCERTAAMIAKTMGIPDFDWSICYQSKVGPLKWIGPSTSEALERAAQDQVPVVIYPHAFVSEHVETLVEIEDEYRELAHKLGVPAFARVETVMTDPFFIDGLADMVRACVGKTGIMSNTGACLCNDTAVRCCMRQTSITLQDGSHATVAA